MATATGKQGAVSTITIATEEMGFAEWRKTKKLSHNSCESLSLYKTNNTPVFFINTLMVFLKLCI